MFSNKSISFSKKTQNSANYTSTIMDNASAVLPASLLSASASLFNHFPGSLDLFGGDESDAAGPSPPPPPSKAPIRTSTIVQLMIERAVINYIIVIPTHEIRYYSFLQKCKFIKDLDNGLFDSFSLRLNIFSVFEQYFELCLFFSIQFVQTSCMQLLLFFIIMPLFFRIIIFYFLNILESFLCVNRFH